MKHFEQLAKPDQEMKLKLKWEASFRDLLGDIFWPEYAQWLLENDPDAYQREYFYFISLYDEPPPL